ncbi:MAG: hypothetical protein WAU10_09845 [Caldilineaceae bacterium]
MKPKKRLNFSIPLWWPDVPKNLRSWLPSKGNVLFTTLMILMLVWAQTAGAFPALDTSATSTGTIAYQGRLADSGGNPLTTTVNMTFRLYNAATGGTPLWSEDWTGPNGVQVSDGLFNVMLGSLTAIPQNVITGNPTLFLGITAGTDNEMSPRVQLGSVPFAVQALTVPNGSVTTSKLADKSVTQAKLGVDVSVVPPDSSITTAKLAEQAVTGQKIAPGAVTDDKLNIDLLQTKGVGRFGLDNTDPLEGGQIELAAITGGPRWYFDNYNSGLRWFNCMDSTCVVAMTLSKNGNWGVIGTKSSIVTADQYGQRSLYAVESADVRFSDEGSTRLQNGTIRVQLDPVFIKTIENDFLIQVTPYGDASLYVAEIGEDYFVVKSREGDPNIAFAWHLSAHRKGYADVRLEEVR